MARQRGHSVIGNGPPLSAPSALHFNMVPSITLALDLPSGSLLGPHLLETLGKFPALPCPPAPSAPLKSPLNSVVMQTVSPKRARARCRVRRAWASNAAITSGREGGWIIIKASPLPLMWTCLINTRLLGGDGGMDGWRMRGKRVALLIYLPAEHSVASVQSIRRGGDDTFFSYLMQKLNYVTICIKMFY